MVLLAVSGFGGLVGFGGHWNRMAQYFEEFGEVWGWFVWVLGVSHFGEVRTRGARF